MAFVPFTYTDLEPTRTPLVPGSGELVIAGSHPPTRCGAANGGRDSVIASPALIVWRPPRHRGDHARVIGEASVEYLFNHSDRGHLDNARRYRELRGTKRYYARVVNATQSVTEPRGYVVSDVWWFDQVVAALHQSRTFLYAPDAGSVRLVLQQLAVANVSDATLVWTREGPESAPLNDAVAGTCYHVSQAHDILENSLTFANVECSPTVAPNRPPSRPARDGSP